MPMLSLLFVTIFILNEPVSNVELSVAPGIESLFPDEFISIDQLGKLKIGQSYWVRADVTLSSNEKHVLQGGNWYMQNIQFYDNLMNLIKKGNSIVVTESSTYYLFYTFHDEKDPNQFSITLYEIEKFLKNKSNKDIFQSSFHSVLLFIFLIAIFFSIRNRNDVYGYYAYYIVSLLFFFSYQYGLLGNYFSFVRHLSPSWFWILSASITHSYILFARSFLDIKEKDPINYKVLNYGQLFILMIVIVESIAEISTYDLQHQLGYKASIILIELGLIIVFLYRIAKMGTILSRIFLVGAIVLFISSMTGQIASSFKFAYETNVVLQTGVLIDVFILSIGIAVRVGLIQKSRQEAQSDLINQLKINEKLQQEYTEKLEVKVGERTVDLDKRNRENETLLREVHHRVKNNLQMITSLLNMQQRRIQSPEAKDALSVTKNRVKSIGLIHEHLYQFEHFSSIRLDTYVKELINMVIRTSYKGTSLKAHLEIPENKAHIETAMSIGIILNELVTNSLKYGVDGVKEPELQVAIWEEQDVLHMRVSDRGLGIKSENTESGFGLTIIRTLLEGCEGEMKTRADESGFHVMIKIKEYIFT